VAIAADAGVIIAKRLRARTKLSDFKIAVHVEHGPQTYPASDDCSLISHPSTVRVQEGSSEELLDSPIALKFQPGKTLRERVQNGGTILALLMKWRS
jgi:hypothetical protein